MWNSCHVARWSTGKILDSWQLAQLVLVPLDLDSYFGQVHTAAVAFVADHDGRNASSTDYSQRSSVETSQGHGSHSVYVCMRVCLLPR